MQQLNLFNDLAKEDLARLNSLMTDRHCPRNTELLDSTDLNKLYILKKGRVVLYNLTPSGKKTIISTIDPGSIFGDVAEDIEHEYFATTSEDSVVCTIDKDKFFKFASNCPKFAMKLFVAMFSKLSDAEYKISILSSDTAAEKFKKLLMFLAKKYGTSEDGNIRIETTFTHEELADMIGVTRQTTTEIINNLERQGAISREGKTIILKNLQ